MPDGRHFATGSEDKTIRIVDVATGREVARANCEKLYATRIAISPDGQTIASGGGISTEKINGKTVVTKDGDYAIRLWRLPESIWPQAAQEENTAIDQPTDIDEDVPKVIVKPATQPEKNEGEKR